MWLKVDKTDVSRTISVLVFRGRPLRTRMEIWLKLDKTDISRTISVLMGRPLMTRTEMVLETSVLSTFNHLTRLEARENFIIMGYVFHKFKIIKGDKGRTSGAIYNKIKNMKAKTESLMNHYCQWLRFFHPKFTEVSEHSSD
jgi:hypothetical protein